jgi:hypothetical protein
VVISLCPPFAPTSYAFPALERTQAQVARALAYTWIRTRRLRDGAETKEQATW